MTVRFLGQPFGEEGQFGRSLQAALASDDLRALWAIVAWAKRSGLSRIGPALQEFRARGGRAEVIVGIDEGGATKEGLELARQLFDEVLVFHDPGNRTFHPKLYVVEGQDRALALVGSGNLTKGGMFTNYEVGLLLELDTAARPDDFKLLGEFRAYYEGLKGSGDACRALDDETFAELIANPRYRVGSEAMHNKHRADARLGNQHQQGASLFGAPVPGLAGAPVPAIPPAPDDEADDDSVAPSIATAAAPAAGEPLTAKSAGAEPASPTHVAAWNKRLSASDAQRKQTGHQRGSITLVKAQHKIDPQTYFRFGFFAGESWVLELTATRQSRERAVIPFEVTLLGTNLGVLEIEVTYASNREAAQHNYTSLLHLGPLAPHFANTNVMDRLLKLERRVDGTYTLAIS